MRHLIDERELRMLDLDLLIDIGSDGLGSSDQFGAVVRRDRQADLFGREDRVNVAAPRDIQCQLAEFLGINGDVTLEDQSGRVEERNLFDHAVFDFGVDGDDAGRRIEFEGRDRLFDIGKSGLDQRDSRAHGVMSAHRQPAACFEIQNAEVGARCARLRDQRAGHDLTAARLISQQFTEPVRVVSHIGKFFSHRVTGNMAKTAYYRTGRVSEGMGLDGPEHFSCFHQIMLLLLSFLLYHTFYR